MLTSTVGEINVDIGRTDTFEVQKPFKKTVVIHRIESNHIECI